MEWGPTPPAFRTLQKLELVRVVEVRTWMDSVVYIGYGDTANQAIKQRARNLGAGPPYSRFVRCIPARAGWGGRRLGARLTDVVTALATRVVSIVQRTVVVVHSYIVPSGVLLSSQIYW